jgi:hypothetical protein
MNIKIIREIFTKQSTIGSLYIEDKFLCYTLEDFDRGMTKEMPPSKIEALKVRGKTAIPSGKYKVVLSYSPRFKKNLPLLLNVSGFKGIRIHSGNKPEHTEGCILLGMSYSKNEVKMSRFAMLKFMAKFRAYYSSQAILLDITRLK